MIMTRSAILPLLLGCLVLTACAGGPQDRITAACVADGAFKEAGGRLVLNAAISALPGGSAAAAIVDTGVDQICTNPAAIAAVAADAAAVEAKAAWIYSAIHDAMALSGK
jgi:hypothetical protein